MTLWYNENTYKNDDIIIIDSLSERTAMNLRILFLCQGNTCRSPMAEGIALKLLREDGGFDGWEVTSAGMACDEGDEAAAMAVRVCRGHGIDIASHQTKPLSLDLAAAADYIITMTRSQAKLLQEHLPEWKHKIKPLFADWDVSDPFGGNEGVYEACFIQIEEGIREQLQTWKKEANQ